MAMGLSNGEKLGTQVTYFVVYLDKNLLLQTEESERSIMS